MLKLTPKVKLYSMSIISIGIILLTFGIKTIINSNTLFQIIFFIFLSIVSESLAIPIGNASYMSVTFAVGLCAILVFKPLIASVIISMGFLLFFEYNNGKLNHIFNTSIYKRIFNSSVYCIATVISGFSYILGETLMPYARISSFNILGIIFAIVSYIVINYFLFMILFSFLQNDPIKNQIKRNLWVIRNFIAVAPLGIFMAIAYKSFGWFALLLFYGPLLLARYSFKLYLDMRNVYFETIKALSNAVDAKDPYTNGHSHRVAHYSEKIANKMGLSQKSIDIIKTAAILHDIGKIGIDDHILNKPGNLTPTELAVVQQHPIIGAKILQDVDFLREVTKIIKHHHERYDGTGYPDGLKGGEIPIEAAILAVADAFDSMTSNRPYRSAISFNNALNIIYNEAGKQFNPIVVKSLKDLIEENREMFINVV